MPDNASDTTPSTTCSALLLEMNNQKCSEWEDLSLKRHLWNGACFLNNFYNQRRRLRRLIVPALVTGNATLWVSLHQQIFSVELLQLDRGHSRSLSNWGGAECCLSSLWAHMFVFKAIKKCQALTESQCRCRCKAREQVTSFLEKEQFHLYRKVFA